MRNLPCEPRTPNVHDLEYNAELAIPNSWIRTRESAETGLEILPQRRSLSIMRGAKAVIERSDPHDAGPFGQILKFEPRRSGQPSFAAATTQPFEDDPGDFARFEQAQDEPIDYRHRMIMNLIALAILIALVGLGVWIADTISDLQREQDCLMQGRSNCAPIEVPIPVQE